MDEKRFTIRNFIPSDYTRECPLTVEAWRGIFDGYRAQLGDDMFEFFYGGWEDRKYGEFSASMHKNGEAGRAFTIVDNSDGSVAAMGSWNAGDTTGVICSNSVRSDLRGNGLGSALYRRLLDSMRENGKKYAQVGTGLDDAHASARRAYERAGFGYPVPTVLYFRDNEKSPAASGITIPDGFIVRRPDEFEFERVAKLAIEAWQPIWRESRRLLGDELFASLGDREKAKYDEAMNALKNPSTNVYILCHGDDIAGFCSWGVSDAPGGKFGLAGLNGVADAYKGQRLGLVMQNYIARDMLDQGLKYARVPTGLDDGHAPARKTYERSGFSHTLPSVTYRMIL